MRFHTKKTAKLEYLFERGWAWVIQILVIFSIFFNFFLLFFLDVFNELWNIMVLKTKYAQANLPFTCSSHTLSSITKVFHYYYHIYILYIASMQFIINLINQNLSLNLINFQFFKLKSLFYTLMLTPYRIHLLIWILKSIIL